MMSFADDLRGSGRPTGRDFHRTNNLNHGTPGDLRRNEADVSNTLTKHVRSFVPIISGATPDVFRDVEELITTFGNHIDQHNETLALA